MPHVATAAHPFVHARIGRAAIHDLDVNNITITLENNFTIPTEYKLIDQDLAALTSAIILIMPNYLTNLNNISNLYKVEFRLFEIYGKGLPYYWYWNDDDENNEEGIDSGSRFDKIDHRIFKYTLKPHSNGIQKESLISS